MFNFSVIYLVVEVMCCFEIKIPKYLHVKLENMDSKDKTKQSRELRL